MRLNWVVVVFAHGLEANTNPLLFNIIRHIDSRVHCESKQRARCWSCCIRISSVRHVNKHAVISTGHINCLLVSSRRVWNCMNAQSFSWQTKPVRKIYTTMKQELVNRECILLGYSCSLFDILTVWPNMNLNITHVLNILVQMWSEM